jgi:hypothetical protein
MPCCCLIARTSTYYTCLADCLSASCICCMQVPCYFPPYIHPRGYTSPWAAAPVAAPRLIPCYWLSDMQVILDNSEVWCSSSSPQPVWSVSRVWQPLLAAAIYLLGQQCLTCQQLHCVNPCRHTNICMHTRTDDVDLSAAAS